MTELLTGQTTDMNSQGTEFSVASKSTDSATAGELSYTPDFNKWNGYYQAIPELKAVIDKFASWTFGKGIIADEKNKAKLDKIKGNGKESARIVLKNQWRVALICGDSFAHIIQDNQGRLTNLKPLNPQMTAIIQNSEGIIVRYDLLGVVQGKNKVIDSLDIDEVYHLSNERVADEMHGIPFPQSMETLILSRNEAIADTREFFHKNGRPMNFFEVSTQDTAKLNALETTINTAYKKCENVIIPEGILKEIKKHTTAQNEVVDPLPYIKFLVRQFVTACGMPEIIMGWGENSTEASGKISYLAFQQDIEDKQLYNEEMMKEQLGIEAELEFPADLMEAQASGVAQGMQSSQMQQSNAVSSPASFKKDGNKSAVRPADVKA